MRQVGLHNYAWWNARKDSIRKKRGEEGLKVLVDRMNELRKELK